MDSRSLDNSNCYKTSQLLKLNTKACDLLISLLYDFIYSFSIVAKLLKYLLNMFPTQIMSSFRCCIKIQRYLRLWLLGVFSWEGEGESIPCALCNVHDASDTTFKLLILIN